MSKIHTLEVDGLICHMSIGVNNAKVKFEYRETHPMEVGIYILTPSNGKAVFWRCARSVLKDGLYQDVYPHAGDLRTRTAVNETLDKFTYFLYLRNSKEEASVAIHDHLAVEEFIDAIDEAIPEEDEVPGTGWEQALERVMMSHDNP